MTRHLARALALVALLAPALASADDPRATLDRLCAVAKDVEKDPTLTGAEREVALAERIAKAITSQEVADLFEVLAVAPPEARARLFREGVADMGVKGWSCPALERALSPSAR
jgi:hypothetical protein